MKDFVSKILHISHLQWIFRNFSLHNRSTGYLKDAEQRTILKEVAALAETELSEVPEKSRYLLEIDFTALAHSTVERQSYWMMAIKAAKVAGRRQRRTKARRESVPSREAQKRKRRVLSVRRSREVRRIKQESPKWTVDEVDCKIARDHGLWVKDRGKRPSASQTEAGLPSNKRRKPD